LKRLDRAPYNTAVPVELRCVLCGRRPVDPAWHPFCSERCKLQDLARWLDGSYRIPGAPIPSDGSVPDSDSNPDDSN
jgi:hypothetical protein